NGGADASGPHSRRRRFELRRVAGTRLVDLRGRGGRVALRRKPPLFGRRRGAGARRARPANRPVRSGTGVSAGGTRAVLRAGSFQRARVARRVSVAAQALGLTCGRRARLTASVSW